MSNDNNTNAAAEPKKSISCTLRTQFVFDEREILFRKSRLFPFDISIAFVLPNDFIRIIFDLLRINSDVRNVTEFQVKENRAIQQTFCLVSDED